MGVFDEVNSYYDYKMSGGDNSTGSSNGGGGNNNGCGCLTMLILGVILYVIISIIGQS